MSERASLEELLEFANAVREAGGGNPLDALMPAVPHDPTRCLIAKNLNFNCFVDGVDDGPDGHHLWIMFVDDPILRNKIATTLGLREFDNKDARFGKTVEHLYGIVLPPEIGQVATDFDKWHDALEFDESRSDDISYKPAFKVADVADQEEVDRLREFWPYIEQSVKESYNLAAENVNENGEIII